MEHTRCGWAQNGSALDQDYHDTYWGKPEHDEHQLFKMLMLESQQAGLSWSTILLKMDTLCEAYDDFNPEIMRTYDAQKVEDLLQNPGIIRNRLKVNAMIHNAHAYYALCARHGSLHDFIWNFVDGVPIVNHWKHGAEIPSATALSDTISTALKQEGFKFLGTTTVYAFLQATGVVNDHLVTCDFRTKK